MMGLILEKGRDLIERNGKKWTDAKES